MIAEASASIRPAAVRTADGLLGVSWVERLPDRDRIWYARVRPDGTVQDRTVLGEVDQVTGPLAAGRSGSVVVVIWPARTAQGYAPHLRWIDTDGRPAGGVSVDAPGVGPGEVAIASDAGGIAHVVWSRGMEAGQEIRYRRWSGGTFLDPPRTIGRGDFPGAAAAGESAHIVWWHFITPTTVQLHHLRVDAGNAGPVQPQVLTGRLSITGRFHAPGVVATASGIHVVGTLVQGGFGGDTAQVFYLRLNQDGEVEVPRTTLLPRRPFASEPQLAPIDSAGLMLLWTDRRARTLQIRGGILDPEPPRLISESQVSFSYADSVRSVLVGGGGRGGGGDLAAIWLEVRGPTRFPVLYARAPWAGTRRFIWGIPDLDVGQPLRAGLFIVTAAIISLPVAAALLVPIAGGAGLVGILARALGRGLAGADWRPNLWLSTAVLLGVFSVLKLAITRSLVTGGPVGPILYLVAPATATIVAAAVHLLKPAEWAPDLRRLVRALVWAFVDLFVTVYPWVAGRLARL